MLKIFFRRTHSLRHCVHSRSITASSSAETIDEPERSGSRCAVHFLIYHKTTPLQVSKHARGYREHE